MDNKDDTLTQSQMLKTTDYKQFIDAQHPEIWGHMDEIIERHMLPLFHGPRYVQYYYYPIF